MSDVAPASPEPAAFLAKLRAPERWSLAARFAATGGVVMLLAMLAIGFWVTDRIRAHVTANTAQATALLMDSFVAPLAQELSAGDELSPGPVRALEELLGAPALAGRVVALKVWKPDGHLTWASDPDLIGRHFPVSDSLAAAFDGAVRAEYDDHSKAENATERAAGVPLLEIYAPVREQWTGRVIAVVEFYEDASALAATLRGLQAQSWLVVALAIGAMALALFGIVAHGSRTIDRQREALAARLEETQRVAAQNRALRLRVQRASARAAEINEQYLRRIGADLHDGPAQLVSLAALKLDSARRIADPGRRDSELAGMGEVLREAMTEVRAISAGLSLPDIETLSLEAIVGRAANAHEERTRTSVSADVDVPSEADSEASAAIRIALFRFVQEGLNNAFRHAGGNGQRVTLRLVGPTLVASVDDDGPVGSGPAGRVPGGGLGLPGMRERVESLGGTFSASPLGQGFRVEMRVDIRRETGN